MWSTIRYELQNISYIFNDKKFSYKSCCNLKAKTRNYYLGKCICEQGYMGSRCDRPCQKGFYGFGCRQACPRYTGGKLQCHKGVQNTLL